MNAYDLMGLVKARIPGYSNAEYLRELNACYVEDLYEECKALENSYFQNTVVVTVATQQTEFDLLNNQDGALSAAVDSRFNGEIISLRVRALNGAELVPGTPTDITDPHWQADAAAYPQTPITSGPYRYNIYDRATLRFARPLPVGTSIEVTYIYELLPLTYRADGTLTSTGTAVTGTGTHFTRLVPPDVIDSLPGNDIQSEIEVELQVTDGSDVFNYQVASITDDTHLTLITAPSPVLAGASYTLATVPEFPSNLHYVLATLATANLMSTPGEDDRVMLWTQKALIAKERFKNSILVRQHQQPPRKRRFSYRGYRVGQIVA